MTKLTDIKFFIYFFSFIFKENQVFNEEHNHSQNGNGILEDLPRLVLIDDKCGNIKVLH